MAEGTTVTSVPALPASFVRDGKAGAWQSRRTVYTGFDATRLRTEYYAAAIRLDAAALWSLAGAAQDNGLASDVVAAYLAIYNLPDVAAGVDPEAAVSAAGPARVVALAKQTVQVKW